jgi:hypothetical protein
VTLPCWRGSNPNRIWQFEGSRAVPASHSGRGEACIRDLFNFDFFLERCWSGCSEANCNLTLGGLYYGEILKSLS